MSPWLLGVLTGALICSGSGSASASAPSVSMAAPPDPQALRTRSLAASCAQCHGTDGRPVAGSQAPALAGMPADTLRARMLAFKSGTGPAPTHVMTQLARGFSDAQIDQLARFFAAQAVQAQKDAP